MLDTLFTIVESPVFDWVIVGVLSYLGVLWFALIVWVARDVVNRTSNVLFQIFAILLNIFLPVFGLLVYLIIRPSRTLLEKYYEEAEYHLLSEQGVADSSCPKCEKPVAQDYLFCPSCSEKLKKRCGHCRHVFPEKYEVCPYCGKVRDKRSGAERGAKHHS